MEEEETGQSEGWTEGQELGQRVNTCRSQNERLQEVRQRHNPSHHIFAVNQHQTMHLWEQADRVQPPRVHRTDRARSVRVRYLSFRDPVDDGLQRFVAVTFEDSFHAASSGSNGLPHCHIQVIVGFLRRQVLHHVRRTTKFCHREEGGIENYIIPNIDGQWRRRL